MAVMMEKREIGKTGDGFIDRSKVRILLCDNDERSSEEVFTLLCKCSYQGSCRTSFHPICAREAKQRMEIWGKIKSDEVELRAFCSKHSDVQCDSGCRDTGDIPLTADVYLRKLHDIVLDGENLLDSGGSVSLPENGVATHVALRSANKIRNEDVNACIPLRKSHGS